MSKVVCFLVVVLFLVAAVKCSFNSPREFLKRAMEAQQASKRVEKECCLPSEFSLSASVELTQERRSSYYPYRETFPIDIDMSFSRSDNKLFFQPTMKGRTQEAMVFTLTRNSLSAKYAMRGQCTYTDMFVFRDSLMTEYFEQPLCLPRAFANYVGDETLDNNRVEVYQLYTASLLNVPRNLQTFDFTVKMRAQRNADGSCLPVQLEFVNFDGGMDATTILTAQLKAPYRYSPAANTAKFNAAC